MRRRNMLAKGRDIQYGGVRQKAFASKPAPTRISPCLQDIGTADDRGVFSVQIPQRHGVHHFS